jgi:uncharacterized membrane protein YraQ (UPF0718 family)/copper chaperone CopZ
MILEYLQNTAIGFWEVLSDMAPYLLFGFLVAGLLHITISTRAIERHLGKRGLWSIFKSAILGVPLPLCSCGVLPVAASLKRRGASRGATASFLLSTPQTGIDSVMVTFSLLGPVIAIFRPIAALISGIVGGFLVETLGESDDDHIDLHTTRAEDSSSSEKGSRLKQILMYGFITLPEDIGRGLIVGLLIAGLITAIIPDDFFLGLLGTGFLSMLVMMVIGIPVYVCATASVPVAAALVAKGISPGAALVFLVAGPATNAAALSILWNVLGKKSTFIYLGTVAVAALASGLVLDSILEVSGSFDPNSAHHLIPGWLGTISSIILLGILGRSVISRYVPRGGSVMTDESKPNAILRISGMTCNHCAATVQNAISNCDGVEAVKVDLAGKTAAIYGKSLDISELRKAVEDAGYGITETSRSPRT